METLGNPRKPFQKEPGNPRKVNVVVAMPTPREKMASWTVDELADFLVDKDLQGPANAFRNAGVNGEDFLAWATATELQADLRIAPFTAKKLIRTRDAYLE